MIIWTCGAVCFQFTHFLCDGWENIYTLSYYHYIKSEVWTITHCLGLGHETMVCTVYLSIFLWKYSQTSHLFGNDGIRTRGNIARHHAPYWREEYTNRIFRYLGHICSFNCVWNAIMLSFFYSALQCCVLFCNFCHVTLISSCCEALFNVICLPCFIVVNSIGFFEYQVWKSVLWLKWMHVQNFLSGNLIYV